MNTARVFTPSPRLAPWELTILRSIIGVIMLMHGYQMLVIHGLAATTDGFANLGIPFPDIAAIAAVSIEIVGGATLIVGLTSRFSALALAATMLVALLTVRNGNGFFAANGGYEYVPFLIAGCLALVLTGPGAAALDAAIKASPPTRREALPRSAVAGYR